MPKKPKKADKLAHPKETKEEKKLKEGVENITDRLLSVVSKQENKGKLKKAINYEMKAEMRKFISSSVKPLISDDIPKDAYNINSKKYEVLAPLMAGGRIISAKDIQADTYVRIAQTMTQSIDEIAKRLNDEAKQMERQGKVATVTYLKEALTESLKQQGLTVTYSDGKKFAVGAYSAMVARTARIETENIKTLTLAIDNKGDLVECSVVAPTCDICAVYQGRVYSISGKDKRFPPLFGTERSPFKNGYAIIHPNCRHEFFPFIEENDDVKTKIKDSNRSWEPDSPSRNFQQAEKLRGIYANAQTKQRQYVSEFREYTAMKEAFRKANKKMPYANLDAFRDAARDKTENYSNAVQEMRKLNK